MNKALWAANAANKARKAAGIIGNVEHNLLKKSRAQPLSLRKAINAMCYQCVGGTMHSLPDPGWKRMIGTCTAPSCALYKLRPYQQAEVDEVVD